MSKDVIGLVQTEEEQRQQSYLQRLPTSITDATGTGCARNTLAQGGSFDPSEEFRCYMAKLGRPLRVGVFSPLSPPEDHPAVIETDTPLGTPHASPCATPPQTPVSETPPFSDDEGQDDEDGRRIEGKGDKRRNNHKSNIFLVPFVSESYQEKAMKGNVGENNEQKGQTYAEEDEECSWMKCGSSIEIDRSTNSAQMVEGYENWNLVTGSTVLSGCHPESFSSKEHDSEYASTTSGSNAIKFHEQTLSRKYFEVELTADCEGGELVSEGLFLSKYWTIY